MKEQLISLLDSLPSVLEGTLDSTISTTNTIETPVFHKAKERIHDTYALDGLNNQIIIYLQNKGYNCPSQVLELSKNSMADLVIDTKTLFNLNGTSEEDFKGFVTRLYEDIHEIIQKELGNRVQLSQAGIFINIVVKENYLIRHINQVLGNINSYGTIHHPKYSQQKLLMEYSSPNMAKSMTIGHFRNTIIGQIMYNILQQTSCEHMNRNYVGDRGTAFGKFVTILHYKYKQDPSIIDDITNNPQAHMGVVYAEFKTCPREDKEEIARKIVTLMEAGNEVIMDLWRIIRELSLIDFTTVYDTINVHFDYNLGESFSVKLDNGIAHDLKAKDILHESQGAMIIKMKRTESGQWKPLTSSELSSREEGVDQVLVFAKSDGSTLYAPRDLALLKYRSQVIGADNLIYVVGSEQSGYFEHIITLGEYLGWIKPGAMLHLGYGLYLQNGKKMSSRAGGVLGAYELISDITEAILAQSEGRIDHDIATQLAVSALIINDTKGDISKDVNLDIPSMTKLNGDTGLYIQYTAVRLRSLLEKLSSNRHCEEAGINTLPTKQSTQSNIDFQNLSIELRSLLFQTSLLPSKITHALDLFKPHILTQYLFDLTGRFNKRYNDSEKVLDMNDSQKESVYTVLLVYQIVLEKVMELLHLPRVERM